MKTSTILLGAGAAVGVALYLLRKRAQEEQAKRDRMSAIGSRGSHVRETAGRRPIAIAGGAGAGAGAPTDTSTRLRV
jgi:hypothetical protein